MTRDMWDERYADREFVWGRGPNLFLPAAVEGIPVGRVLDLACGEGRNAVWLARRGWEAVGVDFSPVGIAKAEMLAEGTPVEWVVSDVTEYRPDRPFDLVLVFYLHLPPHELRAAFSAAVEALAPGGTLFAVGHALRNHAEGHGGPSVPELLWTTDMIAPFLEGLEVVELGERDRYVADADATAIDVVVTARRPR